MNQASPRFFFAGDWHLRVDHGPSRADLVRAIHRLLLEHPADHIVVARKLQPDERDLFERLRGHADAESYARIISR